MAETTKIQWTHHTFNPWRGCAKVSPGCANCYAEAQSKINPAVLGEWGPEGKRAIAAESYWKLPLKWDRAASAAGERRRVFCASLGDVFEARPELVEPRRRLFLLIGQTPHLDWLLLTKRPEVALDNWALWAGYWASTQDAAAVQRVAQDFVIPNVWVGVSVEDQQRADERIPSLLRIPARVRFLSCEPLLGPVDLSGWFGLYQLNDGSWHTKVGTRWADSPDWVIVGGESGRHAQPCRLGRVRGLVRQCSAAGVPAFVKQLGRLSLDDTAPPGHLMLLLNDPKGGDPSEWPVDLRAREFPR